MKFREVQVLARDLGSLRDFYTGTLGLALIADSTELLSVRVGESRLTFEQAADNWTGAYHIAFNIAENHFQEAKNWLSQRVPLVADSSGKDEFDFPSWNAHSVYFYDPAGNVMELIARHGLPNTSDQPFDDQGILSISEIGLASENVSETVVALQKHLGANVYDPGDGQSFTALGDAHGLLIVVKAGREWYPNSGKKADLNPVEISLTTETGLLFKVSGPPYALVTLPVTGIL